MNKLKIYHQCGHRYNWNFEICREKGVGAGFILSPINMDKSILGNIEDEYLKNSFFDSQFYSLNISKQNYLSYGFLDYIDNLIDYAGDRNNVAKRNVDFQKNIDFEYIVIPTIDFSLLNEQDTYEQIYLGLVDEGINIDNSNNLSLLNELVTKPFVEYIREIGVNKKILLTVLFDESISSNQDRYAELISTITSYDEISGIYLIPKCCLSYKRISNIQFLMKIMEFINTLKTLNMEVIVGNSDIESILYTVAGADAISLGIYENLRHYDGNRFIVSDGIKQGPKSRLFSYKLLQWIEYTYVYPMKRTFDISEIFDQNEYFSITENPDYNWHFNKPEPYKHYMISFEKLLKTMPESQKEKIEYVNDLLIQASELYTKMEEHGIILDNNSGNGHISCWRTALLQFAKIISEE